MFKKGESAMRNGMKIFLKGGCAGLLVALLAFFGCVEGRTMGAVQSEQSAKYGVDKRSLAEIQEQKTPDRFTQTTAHLQTKAVIDLLAKEPSSNFIPYLNIIFDCLVKEQDLKNSHRVFYHTTSSEWRLAQDVYSQAYAKANPNKKIEDFLFLRFTDFDETSPRDLLLEELKEHGIVDNDQDHLKALLLSVNLSLFGNIDWRSSSTWDYFVQQKLGGPSRKVYEGMMDKFGLTHKYINELMSLVKVYETKENTLLQIFIPQDKVDDIGYLAWSLGMPRHEKSIAWIESHIKKTSGHIGSGTDRKNALLKLSSQFKKNQDDPLFKDLIKSAEKGDFSLNKFLKVYCNTPWEVEGLDHAQARLVFTPNGLLNPAVGIQFYRYSTATKKQLREYSKRLNEIMNKIFAEKVSKGGANVSVNKK